MEGGRIIRTIGKESIKKVKGTIRLTATDGDLTFNAQKVIMHGEKGGVKFLNDYKPPEPLRVTKLEGPFNDKGEKVSLVQKGSSYTFKITEFNREIERPTEFKKIKWALQFNDQAPVSVAQVNGKQEVTVDISETETSDKITIYAYLSNLDEEGKSEANLKVKVGGINTRFYDELGQQIYEIPPKLHKAFNEEYGIKIAYDKENEMLYYEGECTPAYEETSPTAIEHWKRELNPDQTSKGKLLFGYNFGYETYSASKDKNGNTYDKNGVLIEDIYAKQPVIMGVVPGYRKEVYKKYEDGSKGYVKDTFIGNIACIDLGDFDDNLMVKFTYYELPGSSELHLKDYNIPLPKLTSRYSGLARILEHEFIGHALLKLTDEGYDLLSSEYIKEGPTQVEAKLCNVIRREIEIPERISYGGITTDSSRAGRSEIKFGYLNGNNENYYSDVDSRKVEFPTPPKKYPRHQGTVVVDAQNINKLARAKNIIKIKYDVEIKGFTFF